MTISTHTVYVFRYSEVHNNRTSSQEMSNKKGRQRFTDFTGDLRNSAAVIMLKWLA